MSNGRRKYNDSMSMDDYSDIIVADQSSKFRKSSSGIGNIGYQQQQQHQSRRRGRPNLRLPSSRPYNGNDPSVSTGSTSTRRFTMEEDILRHHPERLGNKHKNHRYTPRLQQQLQQQQQQQHVPRQIPSLESLVQKPKPGNARDPTENNRMHRNTGAIPGKSLSSSSPGRRKQTKARQTPKQKPKRQTKQSPNTKPKTSSNGTPKKKNKLKMLNCFASSSNKHQYNDEEALRQQALIAREQYGRNLAKSNSKDIYSFDHGDNGNSPTAGMSVMTMGSNDIYKDIARSISSRSTTRHSNDRSNMSSGSNSTSTKEILEDLREEENELNSSSASSNEERGGSFINLSISDIEEQLEKRESVPLSAVERKQVETNHHRHHQAEIKKQAHAKPRQPYSIASYHQSQRIQQQQQQQQQYQYHQHHEEMRISATRSIVKGKVTPPRGAVSTSWMTKPSSSKAPRGYSGALDTSYQSGSAMSNTTTSQTTTSVVNLARERRYNNNPRQQKQQTIGPRCHFCGGPHWIYDCPHMDESSSGRRRRRGGPDYCEDDNTSEGVSTTTGESSTMDSTASSIGGCGNSHHQSDLLQCQPCFQDMRL